MCTCVSLEILCIRKRIECRFAVFCVFSRLLVSLTFRIDPDVFIESILLAVFNMALAQATIPQIDGISRLPLTALTGECRNEVVRVATEQFVANSSSLSSSGLMLSCDVFRKYVTTLFFSRITAADLCGLFVCSLVEAGVVLSVPTSPLSPIGAHSPSPDLPLLPRASVQHVDLHPMSETDWVVLPPRRLPIPSSVLRSLVILCTVGLRAADTLVLSRTHALMKAIRLRARLELRTDVLSMCDDAMDSEAAAAAADERS
jgi:hypothetical protein